MATFICLFTPISVIDLNRAFENQNAVLLEINVDDVHPGTSSTFTYEFDNTMDFEVSLYLIKVETTNNNELTKNIVLRMSQSSMELDHNGTEMNLLIATIDKGDRVKVDFEYSIDPHAGNEIQGLSETYQLEFMIFNGDLDLPDTGNPDVELPTPNPPLILPSTGLEGDNRWPVIALGGVLMGIALLLKERDDEDET
ncbi:hypothetical protein AOC36_01670 [Erysipelothrix larvae]|uniref:Uncharacterized protein n=1 Tax=Erysipelothrix larvae TaxID=1514105 RepID=A0A0X8GYH3_9FIRM|nr:hypothetical protein [Erysipelothrix larvae]AMC92740.1 hypothetical protein AOC36_01670 [Erysipelothrix larvae]